MHNGIYRCYSTITCKVLLNIQTTENQPPVFCLAIRLWSEDLKTTYPNTGDPGLQGKHRCRTDKIRPSCLRVWLFL